MDNHIPAIVAFNAALLRRYGINMADAGLDQRDAERWLDGAESPDDAARSFGEKYDLIPMEGRA
jgi:hypothetical protein